MYRNPNIERIGSDDNQETKFTKEIADLKNSLRKKFNNKKKQSTLTTGNYLNLY